MDVVRLSTLIFAAIFTVGTIQGIPTHAPSTDPKHNIKHLLSIIGVENEYARFLTYMKLHPPEDTEMKKTYEDLFSYETFISDLSKTYAKYYTPEEITQLISFYSSPLGKKTNQVTQAIDKDMEDTMLNKISDYVFALADHGIEYRLPSVPQ